MKAFLAIILALFSRPLIIDASSRNVKSSLYPNSKLEASLTASAGQATVIAVRSLDDNSVVILSMSPRARGDQDIAFNLTVSNSGNEGGDISGDVDVEGNELTPILNRGSIRIPYTSRCRHDRQRYRTSRIMHLLQEKSGLCLFMTGFASDVQYLVRYAAGHVAEHEHLYGGESPSAQMVVRDALVPCLRDATMSGGSRPFGVQGLVVGEARSSQTQISTMQLITLDPSGNWRYWQRGGVAIGKDANFAKKHLQQALESINKHGGCLKWTDALDVAMRSLLETVEESQNMKETPGEEILSELDAVVIFGKGSKPRPNRHPCAFLSRQAITKSFLKCFETMNGNKAKTK